MTRKFNTICTKGIVLAALAATLTGFSPTYGDGTGDLSVSDEFAYQTGRNIAVELQTDIIPGAGLKHVFYVEEVNGDDVRLKMLSQSFSDTSGYYAGNLRVPAHVQRLLVISRLRSKKIETWIDLAGEAVYSTVYTQ